MSIQSITSISEQDNTIRYSQKSDGLGQTLVLDGLLRLSPDVEGWLKRTTEAHYIEFIGDEVEIGFTDPDSLEAFLEKWDQLATYVSPKRG